MIELNHWKIGFLKNMYNGLVLGLIHSTKLKPDQIKIECQTTILQQGLYSYAMERQTGLKKV